MHKFNLILLVIFIPGCSSPVTYISNTAPDDYNVIEQRSFMFSQSKQATFDDLLSMFANTEFNINKLNMNAYQVKLSLTGQPDQYIDCGTKKIDTNGDIKTVDNSSKNYSYSAYLRNHLETFYLQNNFTGYTNLIVIGDGISSKVMVQYSLVLNTEEKKTTTRGRNYTAHRQEEMQLSSTNQIYSDVFDTSCQSTGRMEQQVVEILAIPPHSVSSAAAESQPRRW